MITFVNNDRDDEDNENAEWQCLRFVHLFFFLFDLKIERFCVIKIGKMKLWKVVRRWIYWLFNEHWNTQQNQTNLNRQDDFIWIDEEKERSIMIIVNTWCYCSSIENKRKKICVKFSLISKIVDPCANQHVKKIFRWSILRFWIHRKPPNQNRIQLKRRKSERIVSSDHWIHFSFLKSIENIVDDE